MKLDPAAWDGSTARLYWIEILEIQIVRSLYIKPGPIRYCTVLVQVSHIFRMAGKGEAAGKGKAAGKPAERPDTAGKGQPPLSSKVSDCVAVVKCGSGEWVGFYSERVRISRS